MAAHFGDDLISFLVREGVAGLLVVLAVLLGDLVEGRLGEVDVALVDELAHMAEQEGEDEDTDMGTVHVRIRHDDDLTVAELIDVKFLANAAADGLDDGEEGGVAVDLVQAGLLHVQHLTAQRQDGLEAGVSARLGGAACGVSLHQVQLGELGVALVAVRQLAGQGGALRQGGAAAGLSGLSGGLTGS